MAQQRYADDYPNGFWIHITANNDDDPTEVAGWDVECQIINEGSGDREYYVDLSDGQVMIDHPDEGEWWVENWEEIPAPTSPKQTTESDGQKYVKDYPDGFWIRVTADNGGEGRPITGIVSDCLDIGGGKYINDKGYVRILHPDYGQWWIMNWEEVSPPEPPSAEAIQESISYIESLLNES